MRNSPNISATDGVVDVLDRAEVGQEHARYILGRLGATGETRVDGSVVAIAYFDDTGRPRAPHIPGALVRAYREHHPSQVLYMTRTGACLVIIFADPVTDAALAAEAVEGARRSVDRFLAAANLHPAKIGDRLRPGYVVDVEASGAGRAHFLPRGIVGGSRWSHDLYSSRALDPIAAERLAELAAGVPPVVSIDSLIPTPKRLPMRDRIAAFFARPTIGGH